MTTAAAVAGLAALASAIGCAEASKSEIQGDVIIDLGTSSQLDVITWGDGAVAVTDYYTRYDSGYKYETDVSVIRPGFFDNALGDYKLDEISWSLTASFTSSDSLRIALRSSEDMYGNELLAVSTSTNNVCESDFPCAMLYSNIASDGSSEYPDENNASVFATVRSPSDVFSHPEQLSISNVQPVNLTLNYHKYRWVIGSVYEDYDTTVGGMLHFCEVNLNCATLVGWGGALKFAGAPGNDDSIFVLLDGVLHRLSEDELFQYFNNSSDNLFNNEDDDNTIVKIGKNPVIAANAYVVGDVDQDGYQDLALIYYSALSGLSESGDEIQIISGEPFDVSSEEPRVITKLVNHGSQHDMSVFAAKSGLSVDLLVTQSNPRAYLLYGPLAEKYTLDGSEVKNSGENKLYRVFYAPEGRRIAFAKLYPQGLDGQSDPVAAFILEDESDRNTGEGTDLHIMKL